MPLKLVPPRTGKTPYWYVRGTYIGIKLDRSTGATEERVAKLIRGRWKAEIERGEYRGSGPQGQAITVPATFVDAAVAYMKAGGERKFIGPILEKLGDTPLGAINQIALDTIARQIYPVATAATLNRQFYTPVSAVLKRAGVDTPIKRPKGWRGKKSTSWLEPDQAFSLFEAADQIDLEFGLFCRFLVYTGLRLSNALAIRMKDLDLNRSFLYQPDSKTGEPRPVHLPPVLLIALRTQQPRPGRPRAVKGKTLPNGAGGRSMADAGVPFLNRHGETRLFRFHASGRLRDMLKEALANAGLTFPRRQGGFHLFCHTYGTWMHRYGNLDTFGLTRTGRWADPRSADRYKHTQVSEESRRADMLPVEKSRRQSS